MPRCRVDLVSSPTFQRQFAEYQKRNRHIADDLRSALEQIEAAPEQAARARGLVRFGPFSLWKYRFRHSDASRGTRGGYRLIAAYDREAGILFALMLYAKVDRETVSREEIKAAFFELRDALGKGKG